MSLAEKLTGAKPPGFTSKAIVHVGFVLAGIVTTLLGPILPFLIGRWGLSDAQAGFFFSAQYLAALAGSLTLSSLLLWRGYRLVMVSGFALIAIGISALLAGGHASALVFTAIYGYGLGLILSAVNLWVAEVARAGKAASELSIVNVAWGMGAIACPALIVFAQKSNIVPHLLIGIGAASGIFAVALVAMNLEPARTYPKVDAQHPAGGKAERMTAILMGSYFFLYVGSESSVGGWVAALAKRMDTSHATLWALAPMFFWGGLMSGRVLAPLILRFLKEERLLAGGLFTGIAGNIALLEVRSFKGVAACGVVIGLSFAAIYPILVASLVRAFGGSARRIGSAMFALASLGGAIMPWLVGEISTHSGGLRAGLLAPVSSCAIMLGLMPLLHRRAFS
jgi:MFS transporter, FHS family, glucose/mannose:H+ symporter